MSGLVVTVERKGQIILCLATNLPLVLPMREDAPAVRQALIDAIDAFDAHPKEKDHG